MGRLRFVKPEIKRYDLSDGDWIEIANKLTVEEEKFIQVAGLRHMSNVQPGQSNKTHIDVDWQAYGLSRVQTYLKAWSFRDEKDKPVPCESAAIAALDPETFEEIETVITNHREAIEQEKKALKAAPAISASLDATSSSSPSGSAAA